MADEIIGQIALDAGDFSALMCGETIAKQTGDFGAHNWEAVEIALDKNVVKQAQTENKRLRDALRSITAPEGAYSRDPAEYRKNVIEWCIKIAEAALAAPSREGDADGELKPEVEARLRESLLTPQEDLLTLDEMRQKLAKEGDADADPD